MIQLADGRRIRARGLDKTPAPEPRPDLYLLAHRPPTVEWDQRWLPWRNCWLPRRRRETIAALVETFECSATQRVEVACEAGKGRGAARAPRWRASPCWPAPAPQDAVPYVRHRYDGRAVRAPWQRWFVRWFARHAAG